MLAQGLGDGSTLPYPVLYKLQKRRIAEKYGQPPHTLDDWPADSLDFEIRMFKYDSMSQSGGSSTSAPGPAADNWDAYE